MKQFRSLLPMLAIRSVQTTKLFLSCSQDMLVINPL